ncbi:hypothetical protein POM88_049320 [Heracleum sosnowskyi]|uniref:DUF4283 domain-containing protein n=1 Tax=Heracleum sosnowskyi TaxID=360622 RepID=A0AAD8GWQ8_9APIA|nr:hypothetical protein POM88_049320 [Heracleum sosnowskyi]
MASKSPPENHSPQLCLSGKFWSEHRTFNKQRVINVFKVAWKTSAPFQIHRWDKKHYLFQFSRDYDKEKVLKEGPWSVMGYSLSLAPWNPDVALSEIDFSSVPFWSQRTPVKDFLVDSMNYCKQLIKLYDLYKCLPKRFLQLNLSGFTFQGCLLSKPYALQLSARVQDITFPTITSSSS